MGQATRTDTGFDVEQLRKDFPILSEEVNGQPLVYLDNGATTQKPRQVTGAITDYYNHLNSNIHRGNHYLSQAATEEYEASRKKIQSFINAARPEEVLFLRGTTEAVNLVASCFGRKYIGEGDEILITAMEHHSNIVPWQMLCEEKGARLKVLPVTDKGELELEALDGLLTERTKLLALVHVSNTLGTVNPVKEIIQKAHGKDIPVMVDGAQATPHMPVDVQDLDADFYAFSGHKMFGPTGVGVLYGKQQWLEALDPYHGGGEMIDRVTFEKTTYAGLPNKFEAGTPHIEGGIVLGTTVDYIQNIGYDNILRHEKELLEQATEGLQNIDGVRFIGEADNKASVISFLVEGTHPSDIGVLIDKMGVAIRTGHHCTQPLMDRFDIPGTARASFAFYNNQDDVDRLIQSVEKAVKMLG